jgi:predicted nucleic acid-binding protein
MILVDTSIIIDFWKNPDEEKADIFNNNDVVICPVIMVELIHGAKSEKQKFRIKGALAAKWEKKKYKRYSLLIFKRIAILLLKL